MQDDGENWTVHLQACKINLNLHFEEWILFVWKNNIWLNFLTILLFIIFSPVTNIFSTIIWRNLGLGWISDFWCLKEEYLSRFINNIFNTHFNTICIFLFKTEIDCSVKLFFYWSIGQCGVIVEAAAVYTRLLHCTSAYSTVHYIIVQHCTGQNFKKLHSSCYMSWLQIPWQ